MSGIEEALVVPEEITTITIDNDTVKQIFEGRYSRPVESVRYDKTKDLWVVDFLLEEEVEPEE